MSGPAPAALASFRDADELADATLLSAQEAAVAWGVIHGRANADIAADLDIPKNQVELLRYGRIPEKIANARETGPRAAATLDVLAPHFDG